VHHRDIRFREAADERVENVLVAPELPGGRIRRRPHVPGRLLFLGVVMDGDDIATRAQPTFTGAGDGDGAYRIVGGPGPQLFGDGSRHGVVQRVDGLGPVQGEESQAVTLFDQDFGFVAHTVPSTHAGDSAAITTRSPRTPSSTGPRPGA